MTGLEVTMLLLAVAVVAVPLAKKMGLGSILGYVVAGAVIGPSGIGLIENVESIGRLAEFGVVFLLFIIGLELQPSRLWTMRRSILGLGSIQFLATAFVFTLLGLLAGLTFGLAVLIAGALSLSSTAFALQLLSEKKQLITRHGRAAFSILLFQDMAAIPILAAIPLLSGPGLGAATIENPLIGAATALFALLIIILAGRYVLRPVYRIVASARVRELFVAVALLTILGAAYLLEHVGLSMALGGFLAGVLLSETEYRHELEADINPFKGLLLGLFFLVVGINVDVSILSTQLGSVIVIGLGLVAVKMLILFILGRLSGYSITHAKGLALSISQGGEFAFVIFASAGSIGVLPEDLADLLVISVTLSMVATPLLYLLDQMVSRVATDETAEADIIVPEKDSQVIIAGFGRYGQMVGRLLKARKIPFTALEADATQVDFVRKFGNKVYYGDVSRLDLLRTAHADKASLFVLAIEDTKTSVQVAELVKKHFPHLVIFARARNRVHAYQLMEIGIDNIYRETFASSLETGRDVLKRLGLSDYESERTVEIFRRHDEAQLNAHRAYHYDMNKLAELAKDWAQELEELFEQDKTEQPSD